MQPRPNVLTDAADTSADAQKLVRQPPAPFQNPFGPKNVSAPPNQNFSRDQIAGLPSNRGTAPSSQGGQATSPYSIHNSTALSDDMLAAIGESRPSGKGVHSVNSGFPTRAAREVGSGNFPTSKRRK